MRHTILSLVLLSACSLSASGQQQAGTWSITPRAGVALAKMGDGVVMGDAPSDNTLGCRYNLGYTAGAEVQYQFSDDAALSLGAMFTREGVAYNDYLETTGDKQTSYRLFSWKDHHINLDYINIPLMAHYYVAPGLSLKAGVQVGYLVSAKYHTSTTSFEATRSGLEGEWVQVYDTNSDDENDLLDGRERSTDVKRAYKKVQMSIPVGVSYEYQNVVLDARYHFGLNKVSDTFGGHDNTITVTVGYKFEL